MSESRLNVILSQRSALNEQVPTNVEGEAFIHLGAFCL